MLVNGKVEEYTSEILEDFLIEKGYNCQRVAVELNKKIVARKDFSTTKLTKDDILEIVHFVGGG